MVLEWLIGYSLTRLADPLLDPQLERKLRKFADDWAASLPSGFSLEFRAIFDSGEQDLAGAAHSRLRQSLCQDRSAPMSLWLSSLKERWEQVRARLGDDADHFFQRPWSEVEPHLEKLAFGLNRLYQEDPIASRVAIQTALGRQGLKLDEAVALLGALTSRLEEAKPDDSSEQMKKAVDRFSEHAIHEFLTAKYRNYPLLQKAGHTYAVAVYPAKDSQRQNPDSVLGTLDAATLYAPGTGVSCDEYRMHAHRISLEGYNRITFASRKLACEPRISLDCYLGSYFDTLDTCDALEWELLSQSMHFDCRTQAGIKGLESALPLRNSIHSASPDPVLNGTGRCAGIAVSTLLAFHDAEGLRLLVHRRGPESVLMHRNLSHVIPSFMFQPATGEFHQEHSVVNNFYREYLEELFDRPEPGGSQLDPKYFYSDPRLVYLLELLEQGDAILELTGAAVSLFSFRPEVCLLLYIKTPEWFQRHLDGGEDFGFKICNEFTTIPNLEKDRPLPIGRIKYCDDDEEYLECAPLHPTEIVPAGAAAFWLGAERLRVLQES